MARINRLRELGPIQEKRGEYHSQQSAPLALQKPVDQDNESERPNDEQNQGFPPWLTAVNIRDKQVKLKNEPKYGGDGL